MTTTNTPVGRLRQLLKEVADNPFLLPAGVGPDLQIVLDELADATDPYIWNVITIHGRSVYETGRLSERDARKRYAEADRSDGRKPLLHRQRRYWTDNGYGQNGWQQVHDDEQEATP